jgi:hypothetical protein
VSNASVVEGGDGGARPETPLLRVVKGDPTVEELAALVAVVAASAATVAEAPKPVPVWAAARARMRPTLRAGRGGWHASGLPH